METMETIKIIGYTALGIFLALAIINFIVMMVQASKPFAKKSECCNKPIVDLKVPGYGFPGKVASYCSLCKKVIKDNPVNPTGKL